MDVLNPTLYRRLARAFGEVRVASAGEAMISREAFGLYKQPDLIIEHTGEYYRINCPFCSDTRFRFYVNHRFAQIDGFGRRLLFLAVCYNEGCLRSRDNFKDFLARLDDAALSRARVLPGKVVPEEAREVLPPGPTVPVDKLPPTHPARAYLVHRGFDPVTLVRDFGVSLCTASRYSLAVGRIIAPIVEGGKLKGWQARYVGELPWKDPEKKKGLPPKYFSCPDSHFRSRCLYNFEKMKEWHTGVVCEGPTDVWRFGSMAGCVFGNSMAVVQRKRFTAVFRKRSGVLLFDPEEHESRSTRDCVEFFRAAMPGRFCAVKLPDKTDPGSLDRDFLKRYVKERAAAQGVVVKYRKVTP